MNHFCIQLILFSLFIISSFQLQAFEASEPTTDCESLITDLCEITLTKGHIQINNDTLAYFFYTKANDLNNSVPLIGINGGPGMSHAYMEPLKKLACFGIPVILYDQVGTGNSTRVQDLKDAPYLLTIEHYLEEINALIKFFDLKQVHVLGHSWGTIVAQEFAIRRPKELAGLILSGALSDSQLYIDSQRRVNLATLPPSVRDIIKKADETGIYNTTEYIEVAKILTYFFTSRVIPTASCMKESEMNGNNDIYVSMQGASEFTMGGVLSNWNVTDKLQYIEAETLVTRGQFDTMTEECSQKIIDNVKKARKLVTIPSSGHIQMIDENEIYINEVYNFLKTVEVNMI